MPLYSEPPANLVDESTLDGLIGRRKESIISILGHPEFELSGKKVSYFIYGGGGDEHQLLLVI